MQDWSQVLLFLQEEITQADARGYPTTLRNLIIVLHKLAEECFKLAQYVQDPENLVHKVCPQCGKDFSHPSRWVKTCSQKCHAKWIADPNGYLARDQTSAGTTLRLMQQMELPEESQP